MNASRSRLPFSTDNYELANSLKQCHVSNPTIRCCDVSFALGGTFDVNVSGLTCTELLDCQGLRLRCRVWFLWGPGLPRYY